MISISSEKNKIFFLEKIETFSKKYGVLINILYQCFFFLSKGLYMNNADGNKR